MKKVSFSNLQSIIYINSKLSWNGNTEVQLPIWSSINPSYNWIGHQKGSYVYKHFLQFFVLKLFPQSVINLTKEPVIQTLTKYCICISNTYHGKKCTFFVVVFLTCPERLVITRTGYMLRNKIWKITEPVKSLLTCLVLFQSIGDGRASESSQCCWWGSSVSRQPTEKHLIYTLRGFTLFSH